MKWWEIAVYTTDEGTDYVCAALNSAGINGLSIEESRETAAAFLRESVLYWDFADMSKIGADIPCVKGYLGECPENEPLIEAARKAVEDLKAMDLGCDLGSLSMTVNLLDEEDWANNWKQYYKPLFIGEKLLILPEWEPEPDTDRVILKIDPGMAFGTGGHHTTRMCLELLQTVLNKGDTLLDMGCGSGILSLAALLLGAKNAVAVDIDPITESIARDNGLMNGIGPDTFKILVGDLISNASLREEISAQYDVITANIVADVILALSPFALSQLKPGGKYIVSGIIDDREAEVENMLRGLGFHILKICSSDCWFALLCEKPL